jgi:hypothetical protein
MSAVNSSERRRGGGATRVRDQVEALSGVNAYDLGLAPSIFGTFPSASPNLIASHRIAIPTLWHLFDNDQPKHLSSLIFSIAFLHHVIMAVMEPGVHWAGN